MNDNNEYVQAHPLIVHQRLITDDFKDLGRNYTDEDVKLVSKVRNSYNNFQVLGLGWPGIWASTAEIENAYTDLSEKLDPDRNKAPGSKDALKKVNEAFKCLSHRPSRILHAFISDWDDSSHSSLLAHVFFILSVVLVMLLFLIYINSAGGLPPEPYEIKVSGDYKLPMTTKEYGIVFYVTSQDEFEDKYPAGTAARVLIEHKILTDYRRLLQTYCSRELSWHLERPDFPTPICNKLHNLGVYA